MYFLTLRKLFLKVLFMDAEQLKKSFFLRTFRLLENWRFVVVELFLKLLEWSEYKRLGEMQFSVLLTSKTNNISLLAMS